MPQDGVTEENVQAAVLQLEREGRPIGLKTVRAHLGRGSYSTLKRHLDRIVPRIDEKRRVPQPSASTLAELDVVVRRVWSTAYTEASRAEAQALLAKTAALEVQRARLAKNLLELRDEARRLDQRLARAEAELRSMARCLIAPPAGSAGKQRTSQEQACRARPDSQEVSR